jgi:hypothetical protein
MARILIIRCAGRKNCTAISLETIHLKPCNQHIRKTLALVKEMLRLADEGDADREDAGCGVLYGVLRDSAYKVKKLAEQERDAHMRKGWWQL